eukprot:CAMPEP_0119089336 /NCGR_PEP_ID=MMETSP1178-20130426/148684_1 /TAXON_ID=33656 /ORGANISM="unid sp, Strain CCMP2000" /LENGTH=63 /DNA_ID=CAMNT_0007072681 /DNA_START=29 /DNA_END=217 /DNA_ORIENTATION=+
MRNSSAADLSNTTVLGLSFDTSTPIATFFEYNLLNIVICSVLPVPLASSMVAVSVLLYGLVFG